ncbi:hypothetical protein D4Q71_02135 [Rhodopseudomonas palustris]|nr:hypothetical protein B1S06_05580 [Rhodopseudomonas palustris]RJF68819.1 hypothetical protein D4Q71_02135 [Rhodopseudomonas palustris]
MEQNLLHRRFGATCGRRAVALVVPHHVDADGISSCLCSKQKLMRREVIDFDNTRCGIGI